MNALNRAANAKIEWQKTQEVLREARNLCAAAEGILRKHGVLS